MRSSAGTGLLCALADCNNVSKSRQIRSEQGEALYRETVKRLAVPIHHPPTARERWFAEEAARVERERSPSSSAEDDNKEASEDNGGEEEDQSGSEDEDDSSAEDEGEDDVEEVASGKVSASSEGEAEFEAGEAAEDQAKTSGDRVESKTAAHAEQSAKDAAGAIGSKNRLQRQNLRSKLWLKHQHPQGQPVWLGRERPWTISLLLWLD